MAREREDGQVYFVGGLVAMPGKLRVFLVHYTSLMIVYVYQASIY